MPSQTQSAPNPGEDARRTLEEYFELEYKSPLRHEFLDGVIRAMGYTSPAHGEIQTNLASELHRCLRERGCKVYTSDRMVYVPVCNKVFYPDLVVVCGEHQLHNHRGKMQATLNPLVIVEILSNTTEEEDKIDKWACYQKMNSLQQYVLVSQREKLVQTYSRTEDAHKWLYTAFDDDNDRLEIGDCAVTVGQIYAGINW